MQQLTDRQQLLCSRLVSLGEMATNNELPMQILEIRGFGSFFRGKPRPRDVDLLIRAQTAEIPLRFRQFVDLLKEIQYDWELEEQFGTPLEAVISLHSIGDRRLSGISDEHLARIKTWIAPNSWNMLRPSAYVGQSQLDSPVRYSLQQIKTHFPSLCVFSSFFGANEEKPLGLRCGFTVSVWSENKPDVSTNLAELLTENSMRRNALLERDYFLNELPRIRASVQFHEAEIGLLRKTPKRRQPSDSWRWFDEYSKKHPELIAASTALEMAQKSQAGSHATEASTCDNVTVTDLATQVDEVRKELKRLYVRNDHLEELRNRLAYFKSGTAETRLPAEEYVVEKMLDHGSKVAKAKSAEFLRNLGFPVDRVLKRESKRNSPW